MPIRPLPGFAVVVAALMGAASGTAAAGGDSVNLRLTGADGVTFEADCELIRDGATETARFPGAVPVEKRWQAEAISCRIRQTSAEGHLQVELTKGGNRTRSRTTGQGSTLSLSVR